MELMQFSLKAKLQLRMISQKSGFVKMCILANFIQKKNPNACISTVGSMRGFLQLCVYVPFLQPK